jgi:ABC-type phosphate transport system substrate-binding protein
MQHLQNYIGSVFIGLVLGAGGALSEADVVTVVSSKSSITALSKSDVADIFLGKVIRVAPGAPAVPIDQPESSTVREEFYRETTGKSLAQLKSHWSKILFTGRGQPPRMVPNSAGVKKALAANPFAIGYIEETEIDPSVRVLRAPEIARR